MVWRGLYVMDLGGGCVVWRGLCGMEGGVVWRGLCGIKLSCMYLSLARVDAVPQVNIIFKRQSFSHTDDSQARLHTSHCDIIYIAKRQGCDSISGA